MLRTSTPHPPPPNSIPVDKSLITYRTVVDNDWHFDNLRGSHLQSQSELYHVSWWYYTVVIDVIGQLNRDVIGYEDL